MTEEAIIIAGGLGTRLRGVISNIPKPMAPVAGKPFLEYLLSDLARQNISHVVLAVGYKYEVIQSHFGSEFMGLKLSYSIENEPLGTGGAIKKAFGLIQGDSAFVLNGDSVFEIELSELEQQHIGTKSDLSISLKYLERFDRYGTVTVDEHCRITGFHEKKACEKGFINTGVYLLNKNVFSHFDLPERFSFEKDIMETGLQKNRFYGFVFEGYFLDIGIPEDYAEANRRFGNN